MVGQEVGRANHVGNLGPVGNGVLGRVESKGRLVQSEVALSTLKLIGQQPILVLVAIECCSNVRQLDTII